MASAPSLYAASRSAGVGTRAQISAGMIALSESSTESMTWRVSGDEGLNPRGARTGPIAELPPAAGDSPAVRASDTVGGLMTAGAESRVTDTAAAGFEAAASTGTMSLKADARAGITRRFGVGATERAGTTNVTRSMSVGLSRREATKG